MKIKPVISEKTYAAANALNKYTFLVTRGFNKIEVGKAIEAKYKVNIVSSNSTVRPGKEKKDWKTYRTTRKPDMVKMTFTLKKGDKIDEFLKN